MPIGSQSQSVAVDPMGRNISETVRRLESYLVNAVALWVVSTMTYATANIVDLGHCWQL